MRPFVEVKLKTPVCDKDGRELLSILKIAKPRVRELRLASEAAKGKADSLGVYLLGVCAGVAQPLIDELELEDFQAAAEALESLMAKDPETGEL